MINLKSNNEKMGERLTGGLAQAGAYLVGHNSLCFASLALVRALVETPACPKPLLRYRQFADSASETASETERCGQFWRVRTTNKKRKSFRTFRLAEKKIFVYLCESLK